MLPSCGEVNLLTTWDKRCRGGIKDREEGKREKQETCAKKFDALSEYFV
jgi:hypothetical protein